MCTIMEKVRLDGERETMLRCIKDVLVKLSCSIKEAMEVFHIPEEEQVIYIDMFKKSK
ncbi:MAG: hypothetical protein IJ583_07890 [Firmicutes bacterium]|nr:hypothetical protein [Bacillota bacterium]